MEKPAQHIIRNNLVGLLAAAVVLGLVGRFVSNPAVLLFGVLWLGQVAVNFLLGIIHWFNPSSKTGAAPYFLSVFLVLIIGFGACSGMAAFTDFNMH